MGAGLSDALRTLELVTAEDSDGHGTPVLSIAKQSDPFSDADEHEFNAGSGYEEEQKRRTLQRQSTSKSRRRRRSSLTQSILESDAPASITKYTAQLQEPPVHPDAALETERSESFASRGHAKVVPIDEHPQPPTENHSVSSKHSSHGYFSVVESFQQREETSLAMLRHVLMAVTVAVVVLSLVAMTFAKGVINDEVTTAKVLKLEGDRLVAQKVRVCDTASGSPSAVVSELLVNLNT